MTESMKTVCKHGWGGPGFGGCPHCAHQRKKARAPHCLAHGKPWFCSACGLATKSPSNFKTPKSPDED